MAAAPSVGPALALIVLVCRRIYYARAPEPVPRGRVRHTSGDAYQRSDNSLYKLEFVLERNSAHG